MFSFSNLFFLLSFPSGISLSSLRSLPNKDRFLFWKKQRNAAIAIKTGGLGLDIFVSIVIQSTWALHNGLIICLLSLYDRCKHCYRHSTPLPCCLMVSSTTINHVSWALRYKQYYIVAIPAGVPYQTNKSSLENYCFGNTFSPRFLWPHLVKFDDSRA